MGRYNDGYDEGWSACLAAASREIDRGHQDGRRLAHLSEESRRKLSQAHPGIWTSSLGLHIPWETRQALYEAGFDQGVRQAEEEAQRVAMIIKRQATTTPSPGTAPVPDAVNEDDTEAPF